MSLYDTLKIGAAGSGLLGNTLGSLGFQPTDIALYRQQTKNSSENIVDFLCKNTEETQIPVTEGLAVVPDECNTWSCDGAARARRPLPPLTMSTAPQAVQTAIHLFGAPLSSQRLEEFLPVLFRKRFQRNVMMYRVMVLILSTVGVFGAVYGGCVFWPLNLPEPTGLIAAIGLAMAWILILAVYLDGRNAGRSEKEER